MTRLFGVALALSCVASSVLAAPLELRQLGGVACNAARLKTVAGLAQSTKAVNKLAATNDPAATDAAATAQGGLKSASDGIKTIAAALLTGQQAPANARDQVAQGLQTASTALGNVTSTDSTTTGLVQDAQTKVQNTINSGDDVISLCGGGGDAAASASATADSATSTDTGSDNSTDTSDVSNSSNSTDTSDVSDSSSSTDTSSVDNTGSDSSATSDNSSDNSNTSDSTDNSADGSDSTDSVDNTGDGSDVADNGADGSDSVDTSDNTSDNSDNGSATGNVADEASDSSNSDGGEQGIVSNQSNGENSATVNGKHINVAGGDPVTFGRNGGNFINRIGNF